VGKNKDVEERNNIIQSVTGKGHSNAWPGTASRGIKVLNGLADWKVQSFCTCVAMVAVK
jgi:hypothetical protein